MPPDVALWHRGHPQSSRLAMCPSPDTWVSPCWGSSLDPWVTHACRPRALARPAIQVHSLPEASPSSRRNDWELVCLASPVNAEERGELNDLKRKCSPRMNDVVGQSVREPCGAVPKQQVCLR